MPCFNMPYRTSRPITRKDTAPRSERVTLGQSTTLRLQIFLSGCNFRCPFCHNTPLLTADAADGMAEEELLAFLKKRQGLLDGVAITGGEPLLRPDLPALLEKIKALGYAVKLDTNGAFPDRLEQIVRAGLADYVAMDVKNSPARYAQTVSMAELDLAPIEKSVSFLLRGTVDYEFRTTAVAELHDDASFLSLADWLAGARRYFIQCFEPRQTVLQADLHAPSPAQLHHWAELVRPNISNVSLRGI